LYRIAVNQALDAVRSRQRRANWISYFYPIADERDGEGVPMLPEGEVPPLVSEGLDRAALRDTLNRAIAELSPEHRTVVQLRLIDELSLEETAEILKCKVGTVNSRLHYACKYLQKKLKGSRE
jgi:RNA polymerase sigma-70 factor (ECF subfamily)